MAASKRPSYTIWTLAGAVALCALVVGLSSQSSASGPDTTRRITQQQPTSAPRMDVVFAVDATGSMGDELAVVKKEVWSIANTMMTGKPAPDIRFGLVFYQDRGDAFLVKRTDLTRNVDKVHDELMAINAGGGGDWQEHVGRGLHEALSMDFDGTSGVSKTIYLVGDAPGHDDYKDGYSIDSAISIAKQKGITINAIGCSGLDSGTAEFTRIAEATGGVFRSLTYQQIVQGEDGQKRSVIYYNGDLYEADEELAKKDWGRGGDVLLKEGRLKPASKRTKRKAASPGAATMNNLDDVVTGGMKKSAKSVGVIY